MFDWNGGTAELSICAAFPETRRVAKIGRRAVPASCTIPVVSRLAWRDRPAAARYTNFVPGVNGDDQPEDRGRLLLAEHP